MGDRADVNAGDYRVTIYAGDQEIGVITQDDFPLHNDSFTAVTLEVNSANLPDNFTGFGEQLRIEISKDSGVQLNVDNVHMTKTVVNDISTAEDTSITIDVLANDTDVDGDKIGRAHV